MGPEQVWPPAGPSRRTYPDRPTEQSDATGTHRRTVTTAGLGATVTGAAIKPDRPEPGTVAPSPTAWTA